MTPKQKKPAEKTVSSGHSGTPYAPDAQLLQCASHADWLMRMLNNLLAIFAHTGQERNALAMRELQAELAAR